MLTWKGRFLCWDGKSIEGSTNLQICSHKPEKKDIALFCDDQWEGECNGYGTVVKTPEGYLFYYRATVHKHSADGSGAYAKSTSVICVAQSIDGITYTKPDLGLYEFNGSKHNNIIFAVEGRAIDTFSVLYDENPFCPPEERFKALTEGWENKEPRLHYYSSADGIHFAPRYMLPLRGTMDSYNPMVWDPNTNQYFVYYRAFHDPDGTEYLTWKGVGAASIRDVRVATSKDFRQWTPHGRIQFEEGQTDYPLYTSQITKYHRDHRTFIGFPVRYCDRVADKRNFAHMPLADYREKVTEHYGREGTAVTDCVIMTSTDGFTFDRRDEAFVTPGPENSTNWWYGNCYTVYGLAETKAAEAGAANELSFYMGENYRIKKVNFRRYTLRLDGFFSWFGPYKGSEVLTKAYEMEEGELYVNFATSARGGVTVSVCDEAGQVLEGYSSYVMFGNSVHRPVEFEKPLALLKGQKVRLKFTLQDAHLYSFVFQ